MLFRIVMLLFLIALPVWVQAVSVSSVSVYSLSPVFPNLNFKQPIAMLQAPVGDDFYVVEQAGVVYRLSADKKERFIDISERVTSGGEKGLLGMAFSPSFATDGWVYLSYTSDKWSLISRFKIKNAQLDPQSEKVVLKIKQPFSNHNGGQIAFGPDGFLYIGMGDGGAAGDPFHHGQDTNSLLGAMLRIDVSRGDTYAIPKDNPFIKGGGRPEIYAWGLRNPWRWSFDRKTGELWLADVGQDRWEEINVVRKGGNYGWNIREGAHCYRDECDVAGLVEPIYEYSHNHGQSVTGGYVYRGRMLPELEGAYLFGDFVSGKIWSLRRAAESVYVQLLMDSGLNISSFAEDGRGEFYVLDYGSGRIFRLIRADN